MNTIIIVSHGYPRRSFNYTLLEQFVNKFLLAFTFAAAPPSPYSSFDTTAVGLSSQIRKIYRPDVRAKVKYIIILYNYYYYYYRSGDSTYDNVSIFSTLIFHRNII